MKRGIACGVFSHLYSVAAQLPRGVYQLTGKPAEGTYNVNLANFANARIDISVIKATSPKFLENPDEALRRLDAKEASIAPGMSGIYVHNTIAPTSHSFRRYPRYPTVFGFMDNSVDWREGRGGYSINTDEFLKSILKKLQPYYLQKLEEQNLKKIVMQQSQEGFMKASSSTVPRKDESVEEEECCVCHEPAFTTPTVKTACGHLYHQNCIEHWKNSRRPNSDKCPLCRAALKWQAVKRLRGQAIAVVENSESEIKRAIVKRYGAHSHEWLRVSVQIPGHHKSVEYFPRASAESGLVNTHRNNPDRIQMGLRIENNSLIWGFGMSGENKYDFHHGALEGTSGGLSYARMVPLP